MPDPNWGGARSGAGRLRQRITLDLETARYLRAIQQTMPDDARMTADEIVAAFIRGEAHARGWCVGNSHRAEFERMCE